MLTREEQHMDLLDKAKGFLFEPSKALYNSREDSLIQLVPIIVHEP
jgi:hypothetical protein